MRLRFIGEPPELGPAPSRRVPASRRTDIVRRLFVRLAATRGTGFPDLSKDGRWWEQVTLRGSNKEMVRVDFVFVSSGCFHFVEADERQHSRATERGGVRGTVIVLDDPGRMTNAAAWMRAAAG